MIFSNLFREDNFYKEAIKYIKDYLLQLTFKEKDLEFADSIKTILSASSGAGQERYRVPAYSISDISRLRLMNDVNIRYAYRKKSESYRLVFGRNTKVYKEMLRDIKSRDNAIEYKISSCIKTTKIKPIGDDKMYLMQLIIDGFIGILADKITGENCNDKNTNLYKNLFRLDLLYSIKDIGKLKYSDYLDMVYELINTYNNEIVISPVTQMDNIKDILIKYNVYNDYMH